MSACAWAGGSSTTLTGTAVATRAQDERGALGLELELRQRRSLQQALQPIHQRDQLGHVLALSHQSVQRRTMMAEF